MSDDHTALAFNKDQRKGIPFMDGVTPSDAEFHVPSTECMPSNPPEM